MNYKTRQPFPHTAYVEGQRNFTYFDRSLTSGLTDIVIESPGDFLYIDQASTGVVSVELNMRQGGTLAPILLAAGGSIECDFASIKINATAQLNKTVRVIVGNGARIKGGANVNADSMSISVVDGGLARTVAGIAFVGMASQAAVAAQLPQAQIWNPGTTGKNVYVERLSFSSATAQGLQLGYHNAAYTSASTDALNKYLGQAIGAAQMRVMANAAAQFTAYGPAYLVAANTPFTVEFAEPVLVSPGTGFCVFGGTANTNLVTNFEWYEK